MSKIKPEQFRKINLINSYKFVLYVCNVLYCIILLEKPETPSFTEDCRFTKLIWQKSSDKSVNYTLQVREKESNGVWADVITSIDTTYSPSNNNSLSKEKDYEFRVVAKNCVGSTMSQECLVKGKEMHFVNVIAV